MTHQRCCGAGPPWTKGPPLEEAEPRCKNCGGSAEGPEEVIAPEAPRLVTSAAWIMKAVGWDAWAVGGDSSKCWLPGRIIDGGGGGGGGGKKGGSRLYLAETLAWALFKGRPDPAESDLDPSLGGGGGGGCCWRWGWSMIGLPGDPGRPRGCCNNPVHPAVPAVMAPPASGKGCCRSGGPMGTVERKGMEAASCRGRP